MRYVVAFFVLISQAQALVYPVGNQDVEPTSTSGNSNGYKITQGFNNEAGHVGVDLANGSTGGGVRSVDGGIVTWVQISSLTTEFGTMVRISHQLSDGTVYYSQYSHLMSDSVTVKKDDPVIEGQAIGKVGNTGKSSGPHLDFQIKKVNRDGCGYINENCSGDDINNYYDPLQFIEDHKNDGLNIAGYWKSGDKHQAIWNCYNQFSSLVGQPSSNNNGGLYVHRWYSQDGSTFVEIQDFYNPATQEYYAIIFNPRLGKAFLLKGGFRWVYTTQYDGPSFFGPPMTNEQPIVYYPIVNGKFDYTADPNIVYISQEFEVGKMMLWNQGNEFYVEPMGGSGGGSVSITLLPGDGSVLNLLAYVKSADSIVVSGSWILGAVRYQVFREGQYAGDLDNNLNFVDSGLVSATAYRYYLVALDSFGRTLTTSLEVSATTMAQNLI